MAKEEFITIRVEPETKTQLYRLAGSEHKSLSEFIRDSLLDEETEDFEMPKPEYKIIDEDNQKGYPPFVIKKVLIDKIEHTYNTHKLAELVSVLFDTEPDIVRWIDDDELALALPKDDDEIQKHLAGMAIGNQQTLGIIRCNSPFDRWGSLLSFSAPPRLGKKG
jgi:hypothetical protein